MRKTLATSIRLLITVIYLLQWFLLGFSVEKIDSDSLTKNPVQLIESKEQQLWFQSSYVSIINYMVISSWEIFL